MEPRVAFGVFSYDLAQLLGGAVLVLSFGLLCQRRIGAMINLYALQALLLAAATAWQGQAQGAPELFLAALIALGAKGIAMPLALHGIVRRLRMHRAVATALGVFPGMVIGVALVMLAILVVLPTPLQSQALTREDLALALPVVLLGLLMMVTWHDSLARVIGFLSLENGLILAAVGVAGMPMVVVLSVAVLVLLAGIVSGLFFLGIHLDRIGEAQR
jgi:hydrogenase-4 component E